MKHLLSQHRLLLVPLLLTIGILTAAAKSESTSYEITITKEAPRIATVEASLVPDEDIIFMNDEGDQGLTHGWSTFVHGLEVLDASGEPIGASYEPLSRWRLERIPTGPVTVRYKVLLQHDRFPLNFGDNGAAYARDGAVMWAGRALFVAGRKDRDIEVIFDLPEGWVVSTPWALADDQPGTFLVSGTTDLVNSAFMAGKHIEQVVRKGNLELRLALTGPQVTAAQDLFASELAKYLDYYETTIGSAPRRKMIVIAADSSYWGGEVMGRAISLSVGGEITASNPMLAHIFAHEIAHLWGLDMNFSDTNEEELYWFYEGMLAEYLSYLANVRLGDIPEEMFLAQVADHHSKYRAAWQPGLSMSTAGLEKAEHYDLIYSGGMMTAAALDLAVRAETNNQQGLEDLIRTLYLDYPRTGGARSKASTELLESGDISTIVASLSGDEAGIALRSWVDGSEEIPLSDLLAEAGLILLETTTDGESIPEIRRLDGPSEQQNAIYRTLVAPASRK